MVRRLKPSKAENEKAEVISRDDDNRYRAVVEDQTEVISRFKADGAFTFVNDVYCRFFGKRRRQLLGNKWHPMAVAEDLPKITSRLRRLTPSNPVVTIENRVYSGNGKIHWMQFVNRGFFDRRGRLVEIQSVGRDITELKKAEQALRESESRFRAVYEHSMAAILLTAPDGSIFAANTAACKLLGRTEQAICRVGRAGIVDKNDPRIPELIKERSQKGRAHGELNVIRADGKRIPVYVSSALFESGKAVQSCMVMQDLSEIKGAEERTRNFAQKLLSIREEEKSRISDLLHHEVGSFAVGVASLLDAAEEDLRENKFNQALVSIRKCRRLFKQSAQQLRKAAIELHPPDLDLVGLHAAFQEHFRSVKSKTSLSIHYRDETRKSPLSPDVQIFLFRTVQEFLNNTVKHARAHNVWVKLSAVDGLVRLSARDDGKGFDVDQCLAKPGMRLGLRAMKEMAAALGGSLEISSKRGKGVQVIARVAFNAKY